MCPTFIHGDDVWMPECRHDLNLAPDPTQVLLRGDLLLADRLDGILKQT